MNWNTVLWITNHSRIEIHLKRVKNVVISNSVQHIIKQTNQLDEKFFIVTVTKLGVFSCKVKKTSFQTFVVVRTVANVLSSSCHVLVFKCK